MVPTAAVLVIGDDDRRVLPVGAVLHCPDELGHVLLPAHKAGVAGVLVVRAQRFHEGDRRQRPVAEGPKEVRLIFQMFGPGRLAIGKVRKVVEGLVVILEQRVRLAGDGVVPAA